MRHLMPDVCECVVGYGTSRPAHKHRLWWRPLDFPYRYTPFGDCDVCVGQFNYIRRMTCYRNSWFAKVRWDTGDQQPRNNKGQWCNW